MVGPDDNLWFTESKAGYVGTITTTGGQSKIFTEDYDPFGIATGSDGKLWFVMTGDDQIASVSPSSHDLSYYSYTDSNTNNNLNDVIDSYGITPDSSGDLWFTEFNDNEVGEFNPTTGATVEFASPSVDSEPYGVAVGENGNVYYTEVRIRYSRNQDRGHRPLEWND